MGNERAARAGRLLRCWRGGLVVAAILLVAGVGVARAEELLGRVVGVTDGDTIQVLYGERTDRIRLDGIDCPESHQDFGARASQFTSELVFGQTVSILSKDIDKYGRTVAEVVLSDGRSLNRELVRAGFAWWYRQYSRDQSLGELEAEARAAGRGLWAIPDPVPPWEFRRGRRSNTTSSTRDKSLSVRLAPSSNRGEDYGTQFKGLSDRLTPATPNSGTREYSERLNAGESGPEDRGSGKTLGGR